jgi:hypothetical protein
MFSEEFDATILLLEPSFFINSNLKNILNFDVKIKILQFFLNSNYASLDKSKSKKKIISKDWEIFSVRKPFYLPHHNLSPRKSGLGAATPNAL